MLFLKSQTLGLLGGGPVGGICLPLIVSGRSVPFAQLTATDLRNPVAQSVRNLPRVRMEATAAYAIYNKFKFVPLVFVSSASSINIASHKVSGSLC